jgi:DNA-binding NarL/FixJ family response regulator
VWADDLRQDSTERSKTVPLDKTVKRIRVILADDNKEMLDTVAELLASASEFDIVGTFADGRALVDAALELKPDIAIIDISMPILNGIMAAAEIKRLGSTVDIIYLTVNEDCDFVRAAFEIGASGYVLKRRMASDLKLAIHACLAGRRFISSGFEAGPVLS